MDASEYEMMYRVEDSLWWYAGMRKIAQAVLDGHVGGRSLEILDAGCGTGANLGMLATYGVATGLDLEPVALDFCAKRGLTRLVQGSVTGLPLADGSFDLVTSLEVLYHLDVSDDALALAEFGRALRPGGWLLLRLPAYNWLRGRHDIAVHTRHRYTTGEVRSLLSAAGFSVVRLSYANCLLFPLFVLKRMTERLQPTSAGSDVGPPPRGNGLLTAVLSAEARWLRRHSFPWGLTVICLARKG
jgi:SAM-dependent methyltransferase